MSLADPTCTHSVCSKCGNCTRCQGHGTACSSQLRVGVQVRLIPAEPMATPLGWRTVDSLSENFATLDGRPVSRRVLEEYIAAGRVELDETVPAPCGECGHARMGHWEYDVEGEPGYWWCQECAGNCEYVPAPDASWLLAQAAACMVGMGFRMLARDGEAS